MKIGDTFKLFGNEWEILDTEFEIYDGTAVLCLSKNIIKEMPMYKDGCEESDNYACSDIDEYLAGLTDEYREQGAEFVEYELDALADDGNGWDKPSITTDGLFLLTKDMYRRYRRHISNKSSCWWLSTRWSYDTASYFCIVSTNGGTGADGAHNSYGLAPAFLIKSAPLNNLSRESKANVNSDEVGCEWCKYRGREHYERPCSLCCHAFVDKFERCEVEK